MTSHGRSHDGFRHPATEAQLVELVQLARRQRSERGGALSCARSRGTGGRRGVRGSGPPRGAGRVRAARRRGPQRFHGAWHDVLPMDNQISETALPTTFTEIWVPTGLGVVAVEL